MLIKQVTATGEEHGLVNVLTNSVEFNDFKHMSPSTKAKLEKEKKRDSEIKKVRYLNSKGQHERLDKPYCKYAGEPIQVYHLIPNRVYELPLGMINEVNEMNKNIKNRSGLIEVDGKSVKDDGSPLDKDQPGNWVHMLVAEF